MSSEHLQAGDPSARLRSWLWLALGYLTVALAFTYLRTYHRYEVLANEELIATLWDRRTHRQCYSMADTAGGTLGQRWHCLGDPLPFRYRPGNPFTRP